MITNLDSESDEHFCLVLLPAMAISTVSLRMIYGIEEIITGV